MDFKITFSKPSVSGFGGEEEKQWHKEAKKRERKLAELCGNCGISLDEVKLIRAQGECLGIRSR